MRRHLYRFGMLRYEIILMRPSPTFDEAENTSKRHIHMVTQAQAAPLRLLQHFGNIMLGWS